MKARKEKAKHIEKINIILPFTGEICLSYSKDVQILILDHIFNSMVFYSCLFSNA